MPLRLAGEALEVQGVDPLGWLREVRAFDALPGLSVDQRGTRRILELRRNGSPVWYVGNAGHLLPAADALYDIGSSTRIRNVSATQVFTNAILQNGLGYVNVSHPLRGSDGGASSPAFTLATPTPGFSQQEQMRSVLQRAERKGCAFSQQHGMPTRPCI